MGEASAATERSGGLVRALRWPIAIAILAAAAWLLRGLDFARLAGTLRGASLGLLLVASALNVTLNVGSRTLRLRALLPPSPRTGRPVGFVPLAEIVSASQATNNLLPFRAGEAVRTIALTDREGFTLREVLAAQVVEKLVELASLVTIALPIVGSKAASRAFVGRWLLLVGAVFGGVAILIVLRRAFRDGDGVVRRFLRQVIEALRVVGQPRRLARCFGWALASDVVDLATIALALASVDLSTGVIGWIAIFVAVNLAIAVPSTPGQVGVLEAGAVLVLAGLGVERDRALAFAILYHAVHVVPFTLAGGVALARTAYRDRKRPRAVP